MHLVESLRYNFNKFLRRYKNSRIWAKYGDATRYHFSDDSRIVIGDYTYGVPTNMTNKLNYLQANTALLLKELKYFLVGVIIRTGVPLIHFIVRILRFFQMPKGIRIANVTILLLVMMFGLARMLLYQRGVNIGNGVVIGAGSVVSKDIPPYAIAVGNPIKIIRYRFPKETIELLEQIKWWDWDVETINKELPNILNPNFSDYLKNYLK